MPRSRLPSSAELDRRLEAARELADRAQRHSERMQQLREDNNFADIITRSLGISHGNGGKPT